jgi:excisionase family DNA binding protein
MTTRPISLIPTAKRLGVDAAWLREEAEAGRIPHVQAGRHLLFNIDAVQRVLAERAGREGLREGATQ